MKSESQNIRFSGSIFAKKYSFSKKASDFLLWTNHFLYRFDSHNKATDKTETELSTPMQHIKNLLEINKKKKKIKISLGYFILKQTVQILFSIQSCT